MEHKPIYLDGVDVSGCEHLTEIRGCWLSTCDYLKHKGNITSKVCKYNPNCYFKQLARKTQECEELKEKCEELKEDRYNLNMEMYTLDRYRKALEEIEAATKINCEEICGRKFVDCNDTSCFSVNILDIINKAKGENKSE